MYNTLTINLTVYKVTSRLQRVERLKPCHPAYKFLQLRCVTVGDTQFFTFNADALLKERKHGRPKARDLKQLVNKMSPAILWLSDGSE